MNAAAALRLALKKRAPQDGIARWLDELAEAAGYAEGTVKNDYYGQTQGCDLDRLAIYAAVFANRGDNDFADEVLALVGLGQGARVIPIEGRRG